MVCSETPRNKPRSISACGKRWLLLVTKDVLVTGRESVRTDATAGKKDSKVNYLKFIPIISSSQLILRFDGKKEQRWLPCPVLHHFSHMLMYLLCKFNPKKINGNGRWLEIPFRQFEKKRKWLRQREKMWNTQLGSPFVHPGPFVCDIKG